MQDARCAVRQGPLGRERDAVYARLPQIVSQSWAELAPLVCVHRLARCVPPSAESCPAAAIAKTVLPDAVRQVAREWVVRYVLGLAARGAHWQDARETSVEERSQGVERTVASRRGFTRAPGGSGFQFGLGATLTVGAAGRAAERWP